MIKDHFKIYLGIDLDNCDIEWFALETNRDHSVVFETECGPLEKGMASHFGILALRTP